MSEKVLCYLNNENYLNNTTKQILEHTKIIGQEYSVEIKRALLFRLTLVFIGKRYVVIRPYILPLCSCSNDFKWGSVKE